MMGSSKPGMGGPGWQRLTWGCRCPPPPPPPYRRAAAAEGLVTACIPASRALPNHPCQPMLHLGRKARAGGEAGSSPPSALAAGRRSKLGSSAMLSKCRSKPPERFHSATRARWGSLAL